MSNNIKQIKWWSLYRYYYNSAEDKCIDRLEFEQLETAGFE